MLLIALNFEAALRVSYTSNILALKKQLFTSDIQEAKYEALKALMNDKNSELNSYNDTISALQQENSKLITEHEKNAKSLQNQIKKLQKVNSELLLKFDTAAFVTTEKDSKIEELIVNLNNITSQNESLERQLKHTTQQIEKTNYLEQKLAKLSIMIQNEYETVK